MRMRSSLVFVGCLWSWCACAGAPQPAPRDGTLVVLRTGPRTAPLDAAQSRELFAGHFANMQRLAREGHLLLAGPYGEEKTDAALRGIFLLDTGDPAQAKAWAETDPTARAGVFALEYHAFATGAPLREVLTKELAEEDAAKTAGRTRQPGEGCRGYVLLTADDYGLAAPVLAARDDVVCLLRLDGTRALAWIDAPDPTTARAQLASIAPRLGAFRLDAWFGSGHLAELPRTVR